MRENGGPGGCGRSGIPGCRLLELCHLAIGISLRSLGPRLGGLGPCSLRLGTLPSDVGKGVGDGICYVALGEVAQIQVVGGRLLQALGGRLTASPDPSKILVVIVFLQKSGKGIIPSIQRELKQGTGFSEQFEQAFLLPGMHLQHHGLLHRGGDQRSRVAGIIGGGPLAGIRLGVLQLAKSTSSDSSR